ncbi:uncharacterized protein LOC26526053 [Drosophila erecta]|nr:uncharacterized protein LOC26526053 [Drosophila erecta]
MLCILCESAFGNVGPLLQSIDRAHNGALGLSSGNIRSGFGIHGR